MFCPQGLGAKLMIDRTILNRMLGSTGLVKFLETYNVATTFFLGFVTLTVMLLLFFNIAKLSHAADNDHRRQEATGGILTCLVCLAVMGGIDSIYAMLLAFVMGI